MVQNYFQHHCRHQKIAADIKANGSERERADFNKQLDKIIEHPFFDKNRIAA